MHIGRHKSLLPNLLRHAGGLPAEFARDGAVIRPGHIYVAPPDHHTVLEPGRIRLSHGPKINFHRPAADPLFLSAAAVYRVMVMGIVLSGGDSDGAQGIRAIKERGGIVLVQEPTEAPFPSMPRSAIEAGNPDGCLPVAEIAERVRTFCSPAAAAAPAVPS